MNLTGDRARDLEVKDEWYGHYIGAAQGLRWCRASMVGNAMIPAKKSTKTMQVEGHHLAINLLGKSINLFDKNI